MSNNIDFVIGGKDKATPVMEKVGQSLERLEKRSMSLRVATVGLASAVGKMALAWGAWEVAKKVAGVLSGNIIATEEGKAAYDKLAAAGDRLGKKISELLAPLQIVASQGIAMLADAMTTILIPAAEASAAMFAKWNTSLMASVKAVAEAVVAGFTLIEVVIGNLGSVWDAMAATAELRMLQVAGAVSHTLTEVVPKLASWFADNFTRIVADAMSAAVTAVTNGVQNLSDAFTVLWQFIESGGQGDILGQLGEIAGRSYLDGFKSTIGELPEIAGRAISDREKELEKSIGAIGERLGTQYAEKVAERMKLLSGLGGGAAATPEIAATQLEKQLGKASQSAPLQAVESRLLTRGPASRQTELMERTLSAMLTVAKAAERTANATSDSVDALDEIRDNTGNTVLLVPTT